MTGPKPLTHSVSFEIEPMWGGMILPWHPSDDEVAWRKAAQVMAKQDAGLRMLSQIRSVPPCHALTDVVVTVTDPHNGKAAPTASSPMVEILLDALAPHRRSQGRVFSRSWFTDPERTRRSHKVDVHATFDHDDARCARSSAGCFL